MLSMFDIFSLSDGINTCRGIFKGGDNIIPSELNKLDVVMIENYSLAYINGLYF